MNNLKKLLLTWLVKKGFIKLRIDEFHINKKTKQISFTVPLKELKFLGNFEPIFADVYFKEK